jgi:hypothetical protein
MKGIFYNDNELNLTNKLIEAYYEKVYSRFLFCADDLTIIEMGADGITTPILAQHGKVYAFEPVRETFDCLAQTIVFNKLNAVAYQDKSVMDIIEENDLKRVDLLKMDIRFIDMLTLPSFAKIADKIMAIVGKVPGNPTKIYKTLKDLGFEIKRLFPATAGAFYAER